MMRHTRKVVTSKRAASAASRVLSNPNLSKTAKTAAGSALTQQHPLVVGDPGSRGIAREFGGITSGVVDTP